MLFVPIEALSNLNTLWQRSLECGCFLLERVILLCVYSLPPERLVCYLLPVWWRKCNRMVSQEGKFPQNQVSRHRLKWTLQSYALDTCDLCIKKTCFHLNTCMCLHSLRKLEKWNWEISHERGNEKEVSETHAGRSIAFCLKHSSDQIQIGWG